MKTSSLLIPLVALAFAVAAQAQTKIWRCGSSYTNDEAQARSLGCKPMEGGNVTVVTGTRVNSASAPRARDSVATAPLSATPGSAPGQRVDSGEQKARDTEARTILEAELRKAEARQSELLQEWNKGEPEKLGPEHRNHQKYLDRVTELKAALERNEKDIAGLKRELGRASR
jgi:predicted  nucleic acid-binding Zn-ribbon protein